MGQIKTVEEEVVVSALILGGKIYVNINFAAKWMCCVFYDLEL